MAHLLGLSVGYEHQAVADLFGDAHLLACRERVRHDVWAASVRDDVGEYLVIHLDVPFPYHLLYHDDMINDTVFYKNLFKAENAFLVPVSSYTLFPRSLASVKPNVFFIVSARGSLPNLTLPPMATISGAILWTASA